LFVAVILTSMLVSLIFPFSRLGINLGFVAVYFVLAVLHDNMIPPHMRLFWVFGLPRTHSKCGLSEL